MIKCDELVLDYLPVTFSVKTLHLVTCALLFPVMDFDRWLFFYDSPMISTKCNSPYYSEGRIVVTTKTYTTTTSRNIVVHIIKVTTIDS